MSNQLDFYRARAAQAKADADAATLDNVRDRCRRSEAAWVELAERAERTEQMRDRHVQTSSAAQPLNENESVHTQESIES